MSRLIGLTVMALGIASMKTHGNPPPLLLIAREWLRPGAEAAYAKNESEIAEASATLKCPHPYLALLPITRPDEVWWLNSFASEEEMKRVEQAYSSNKPFAAALKRLTKRKEKWRRAVTETLTRYRPDLARDPVWRVPGTRFFVVRVDRTEPVGSEAVFESADRELFLVAPAQSREAADRIAAAARGRVVDSGDPTAVELSRRIVDCRGSRLLEIESGRAEPEPAASMKRGAASDRHRTSCTAARSRSCRRHS